MAYELNLRPGESGLAPDKILEWLAELLELHAVAARDGREEGEEGQVDEGASVEARFEVTEGETRATLRFARDDAQAPVGADLVVPYGAVVPEVEALIKRVLETATGEVLVVFDPQLGGPVAQGDLGRVIERYGEDSSYHVHFAGNAEDARQGIAAAKEADPYRQPRASVQVKVLLGLVGLGLVAWLFFRACVISPMMNQLAGDQAAQIPRGGPPPGWLAHHPPTLDQAADAPPAEAPPAASE